MKKLLALFLAATLAGCAIKPVQPDYVSINSPCLSSIYKAMADGSDEAMAGMGLAAINALGQAGFDGSTDSELLDELGETCATNPEMSFIEAANAMMERHTI